MLRIRDLVERTELGLVVVHGEALLDREVRWVHVTELADPTPYVRGAELVLTNGVWLEQGVAPGDYVARVAASDACGLVFGLLRERPEVPAALLAACRRDSLPLLSLPIAVPFTAVSQAMAELQAQARQRELVRSVSRGNALAQAVARGLGERGVLRLLTEDLQLPVALVDAGGHVLAAEGIDPEALDAAAVAAALAGQARAEVVLDGGAVATMFRVGALDDAEAALVCVRALVELSEAERAALEQAARFLTVELARRHAVQAIESRFAGELLEMLYDVGRRGHELPGRLRSFAIDPDRAMAALSVAFADDGPATVAGLADFIARVFVRSGAPAVVPQGSDDAVAIAGWTADAQRLNGLGEELARALAHEWPARRVVVGIGALAEDVRQLRRSVLEAREARRVAQRRRRGPAVATFDHVGSHRMLLALHDAQTLRDFAAAVLGPVREYDRGHRSDLERTLRTFLDRGGRYNESAAALHLHVNTLRNRLARIEELTNRDLGSTDDRVDMYLALTVEDAVPSYSVSTDN
jgi:PucR family transcriptional regulator, purine catabolism regulatory protein